MINLSTECPKYAGWCVESATHNTHNYIPVRIDPAIGQFLKTINPDLRSGDWSH